MAERIGINMATIIGCPTMACIAMDEQVAIAEWLYVWLWFATRGPTPCRNAYEIYKSAIYRLDL